MGTFSCISLADAEPLIADSATQVVDIRDGNSFANGHIPGAIQLHNENLPQFIAAADFSKPLVVVCYHGNSSQGAGRYLAEQGFEHVFSLDGGMATWAVQYPDKVESGL
ncbi:thiosulfate sulfurtransferase GlpE [Aliidiomarina iranensis]|uniref:Thiosulfate sulfurtransferase GlpE n=1 Tax=Aliidiomarina iranensis TaxID=1434071 RepID=A0A432W2K0_9GAMM|nr:thiosulfate sulfurtransferase GlpE [Aliidiomarina iranensis]RUO23393.1 thiosulfate sulfurtransferase GlpE [Aliidiomarina iranensis]